MWEELRAEEEESSRKSERNFMQPKFLEFSSKECAHREKHIVTYRGNLSSRRFNSFGRQGKGSVSFWFEEKNNNNKVSFWKKLKARENGVYYLNNINLKTNYKNNASLK